MGVLMAGLAFPLIGGAGLVAKSGADDFLALPADLETGPPPQRSKILAADGSLLAPLYLRGRRLAAGHAVPAEPGQRPAQRGAARDPAGDHRHRGRPLL